MKKKLSTENLFQHECVFKLGFWQIPKGFSNVLSKSKVSMLWLFSVQLLHLSCGFLQFLQSLPSEMQLPYCFSILNNGFNAVLLEDQMFNNTFFYQKRWCWILVFCTYKKVIFFFHLFYLLHWSPLVTSLIFN